MYHQIICIIQYLSIFVPNLSKFDTIKSQSNKRKCPSDPQPAVSRRESFYTRSATPLASTTSRADQTETITSR